jgi:carboxylesterase type B
MAGVSMSLTPFSIHLSSYIVAIIGYIFGNPANWPFEHWVHQSPNVVIVSVYYRLDSLGFLAISEFEDSSLGDLNAGFRDQIEALKWVKRHIRSFGGDPDRVTINGESAGGASVELHLVANEEERLFSQAIAQSVYRIPLPTVEQQKVSFLNIHI